MDPLTIVAIIEAFMKVAADVPELITLGENTIATLKSGTAPTADQQAAVDAALEAANNALQAS